ncbi:hydantoinase/oxoprolinase family protein (plasmid) [Brucella anthropi]|uniref:5-oxoprolinase (ATP-hydrolyzing) n=1 Tax=Brucella anthropi (strain ATCC 49188 / DSM 6882 / CCUG 24695 / JCM 21032 / LMG 3331 / NBRC 15819 / NCTC 12168 / Alc 37) TaxID=439375 RepID=A6X7R4_BRUA4|nr:hydantoinase/oxoprolinase family protein [Brucella anthropi]ABS17268.1 5-oxoprolinase (ATP-hydrolyzing) [Brucella anthropi ATCC 49188]KAB2729844.1 hydantoinase/oxoprolinase family protein [Brucella anthropi]QQC26788.1 hydantoinase/oxoprolinase family protein [Brucella anthropi]SUB55789.1 Acetone carboxylase beta subunit [Brucella anthropi]
MDNARIGVDIGGTFTDLVLFGDAGETFFTKVPSTPAKPEQAVLTGIRQITETAGLDVSKVTEVVHGTTVGSNTLLQKVGAKTGLITTKGFRDVLEIGRVRTPTMFDLSWEKAVPLIARRFRLEVDERSTADGRILKPLNEQEVIEIGRFFESEGVESVAICFLNSYRNPENETRALEVMNKHFPNMWVTASVSVLPEIREYERTSTTAVNAYVLPSLRAYFERLENGLREIGVSAPLLISNSNGGLSSAKMAQEKPVFFISSGRSAGVVGAGRLGEAMGEKDLVVFDMGGTTASASLIHKGELSRANEYEFRAGISTPSRFIKAGGYLMRVPTVDVAEVGSGAGSIASIDEGGLMHVGPLSAGADPGPVCYGIGGQSPTVTDANVVLGFLPSALAGGSMKLDVEGARAAVKRDLADRLGLSIEDAAFGIREVVNINMARTIKAVTVERGVDPRDFAILAFGGSGPVHACDLARTLNISRVIFPKSPGVFTATGMLAAKVERYFLRSLNGMLDQLPIDQVNSLLRDMRAEAIASLAEEGYSADQVECGFEADLRFKGQDFELPIALPETVAEGDREWLRTAFREVYKGIYGYASDDSVEIVNIRLNASGNTGNRLSFVPHAPERTDAGPETRKIYFSRSEGWVDTPIYERSTFQGGVQGPLIIQSPDTTIVIPPRATADLDAFGNVVATLA